MIRIIINGKTPSVNHLYARNKWGAVYMKPEGKEIREKIIAYTEQQKKLLNYVQDDWVERLLDVKVTIYEDWWSKKNTVKKKDIANREKFIIDTIMDCLGLDDKNIFHHTMVKRESPEHYAEVEISYHDPNS